MTDPNHAAVAAFFDDIASSFGAGDLPRFRALYQLPAMIVVPQGAQVLHDSAEFDAFFAVMLDRLRAERFARSSYERLSVKTLGPGLALAAMHWTRWRDDGSVLETLGATYTVVERDGRWRIVALIGHGPDAVPTLA
ncbi:MAG: DUF4440 domain-containing protein [Gammaproteobacteria bacterium]|jgi:hypothetical protein|nr:DUF4440 domain-containing protein [Gammaproteobacteria bacterium]